MLSPFISNKLITKEVQKSLPIDHGEFFLQFNLKIDKNNDLIQYTNYNKAN